MFCISIVKEFSTQGSNHYYTNDFARRCTFINKGGHKIQPPRLMPRINRGGHFLFTEAEIFASLQKLIYGDRHIKITALQKWPISGGLHKSIFGGRHTIRPTSTNPGKVLSPPELVSIAPISGLYIEVYLTYPSLSRTSPSVSPCALHHSIPRVPHSPERQRGQPLFPSHPPRPSLSPATTSMVVAPSPPWPTE